MTEKLKVAIIGCGGIANGKHLPSLSKLKQIEIVAFCDIEIEKAKNAAEKYGTIEAAVYEDYKQLLKDPSIDVVHVCTPNISHAEISIAALESGKHVMCEKPMAKTYEEAKAMVEASERTGKKLTIGYNNRYRQDSQYLHKVCERGDLGEIYFAKAHAIRRRAVPTWDPDKFTVEDSAFGFITMENGATIVLESSWALNTLDVDEAKCSLSGTEGGADMKDGLRINGENFGKLYTTNVELGSGGVAFYDGKAENDSDMEARLWIESILNDTEPVVKPREAMIVTQILEAIYESAKTGKAVYFS